MSSTRHLLGHAYSLGVLAAACEASRMRMASASRVVLGIGIAACGAQPTRAPNPAPAHANPAEAAPAASAAGAPDAGVDAASQGRGRAPVVVAIEVDQLSAWVAASRLPALPPGGGFARLIREGTWVRAMRYPYAVTDTAPGHAALHTGKAPAETGIFGNEVPTAEGERVSILRDPSVHEVTATGTTDAVSASPARLRVETVADRLRAAHPRALVVSVSLKDRGAILPAGHHPTHALWFDTHTNAFVTSTAFERALPAWVGEAAGPSIVATLMKEPWTPTDAAWLATHAASPDAAPGEGDLDGLGTTFPHVAKTGAAFRAMPASDAALFRLALGAVAAERRADEPTLLLLSLSASDVVGHVFGPDSWEAWDHLRKLDAALGTFLTTLEGRVGPVDVILTADHGNEPIPELPTAKRPWCAKGAPPDPLARPCAAGERLGPEAIAKELAAAVKKAMHADDLVLGLADPYVYLTDKARALPAARRDALDRVIRATLARHQGVAEVYDVRTLAARCPGVLASAPAAPARALPGESVLALVCRSWPAKSAAGDYYVVPKPGSFFDAEIVTGKGTSHGTPYLYDRTVPLLVRAPGKVDAGAIVEDPVDFSVVAAIEAALVGVDHASPRDLLARSRAAAPPVR